MRGIVCEGRAQATVEMAVVLPVLLVVALIVYNLMQFAAATARFDHIVADIVMAEAVSPAGGEATADTVENVRSALARAMEGYGVEVAVACEQGEGEASTVLSLIGALHTYRCTMRFTVWPGPLSIAGVSLGAPAELVHERSVTIDPWRSGVVV